MADNKPINLGLWDTAGQDDYDRLRPLSYPHTDIFLVCFSVTSQTSLMNVRNKWIPEIQHYAPGVPFLLVGTKTDLRDDPDVQATLRMRGLQSVSQAEAEELASALGSHQYIECSAMTCEGVKDVFDSVVKQVLVDRESDLKSRRREKRMCLVL